MEIEVNESGVHAPGQPLARRALLGAGLGGAALSLLPFLTGRAAASPTTDETAPTTVAPPQRPTDDDVVLLGALQQMELTARDLYDAAIAVGGWSEVETVVVLTIREAHGAYANSLSGFLGRQAPATSSETLFAIMQPDFSGDPARMLQAAYQLESAAVATHGEVLGQLVGTGGAALVASIQIAEARYGTVLADLAGKTDEADLLVENESDSVLESL